jgi:hypothetical protein
MVTIEKKAIKDVANSNNQPFNNLEDLIAQSFIIDGKIKIEGESTIYTERDSEALLNRMKQIKEE